MRIPKTPPNNEELFKLIAAAPEKFLSLMAKVKSPTVGDRYFHWHKLTYRTPPEGLTHEDWWCGLKFRRLSLYKEVPLFDAKRDPFKYTLTDPMPQMLHQIDLGAGGHIQMPDQVTNPETRDTYCVSSLIDEAITSSQLEGATTTRPVAKQMIRTGRQPRDNSEQMILNNYLAMKKIVTLKDKPLTKEMVFEIHRIVTENTLEDPAAAGRFRREDEPIQVENMYGEVYYVPPPARQLEERMQLMCEFANEASDDEGFIYPVLRSIILHFWLSYDHPFVDGNGRTARAIFYWSMLKHKYWLCEFISISQIIRKAPSKYARAFLYSETDENDLTYFMLYHLRVIQRAIDELHSFIRRKTAELQQIEAELRGISLLNHRQRMLVQHALRHPNQWYTIESHKNSHNVVYQTARTDLLDLANRNLLTARKRGKAYRFTPVSNLAEQLTNLS